MKLPINFIKLKRTQNSMFEALRTTGDVKRGNQVHITMIDSRGQVGVYNLTTSKHSEDWHKMDAFGWHSHPQDLEADAIVTMIAEGGPANDNR